MEPSLRSRVKAAVTRRIYAPSVLAGGAFSEGKLALWIAPFLDDIILAAFKNDPERVGNVLAEAEGRYTPAQIEKGVDDLLADLRERAANRHPTMH